MHKIEEQHTTMVGIVMAKLKWMVAEGCAEGGMHFEMDVFQTFTNVRSLLS